MGKSTRRRRLVFGHRQFLFSFAARAISSNSLTPSCRCGGFLPLNSLKDRHSELSPICPSQADLSSQPQSLQASSLSSFRHCQQNPTQRNTALSAHEAKVSLFDYQALCLRRRNRPPRASKQSVQGSGTAVTVNIVYPAKSPEVKYSSV